MKNQKGITVLVALFLMVALASLAVNLAQLTVVDTKGITETTPAGIARHRLGPKKEIERLQVFYLAQAGLNHLRKLLVENPSQTALVAFNNNDDATATGYYRAEIALSGTIDTGHTLLADLLAISEGRVLPHDNTDNPDRISTNLELRERYWRSSRSYASAVLDFNSYPPVHAIDTSNLAATDGMDQNVGTRALPGTTPVTLGNFWSPQNCGSTGPCVDDSWVLVDFGMPVEFDEIRFWNEYEHFVNPVTLYSWNDATASWVNQGTKSYPEPGQPFGNYAHPICSHANVHVGDRCTDLRDASGDNVLWHNITGGGTECDSVGSCENLGPPDTSYIARYTLAAPVTARRIKLTWDGEKKYATGPFTFKEIGVYSSGTNVLKVLYGKARVGLQYTASGGLTPLNPNAASVQTQGTYLKGSVAFE